MHFPIPKPEELKQALNLQSDPVHFATGGFKAVFRNTSNRGIEEALKAIHIPKAKTEEEKLQRNQLVARAKREIDALRKCGSPAIVKLGSVEAKMLHLHTADYLTYSEEMLGGEALNHRLAPKSEMMDFESLRLLLATLVDLIRDLFQLGYLHRDIKPDNIMDTGNPNRRFVLLDMGIAYKMQGTDITQGPNPPGTLRYMAPELLGPNYKDSMDFRSELYSAGLTIYVLAAKQHPFAPDPANAYATMYRIMNSRPKPLSELRRDLPADFCRIIDRCIRKRSALRYSSFDAIEADIRKV